ERDGVVHAHADERTRHLAVERPVRIGRLVREPADELHRLELDAHDARWTGGGRPGQIRGGARDAHRGRQLYHGRLRAADVELALHAGLPVTGQRAEVCELTGRAGAEDRHAAGALSRNAVGARIEVRKDHVVLDAVVVHEPDLHDVADGDAQRRIDDAFD